MTMNPTNAKSDGWPAGTGPDPVQQSVRDASALVPAPLILLAPPKSFNSVISAMLGQHPQLYSAPDLNLFAVESLRELAALCAFTNPRQQDGLLRTIAELFLKGQTESSIITAKQWIRENGRMPTKELFKKITTRVAPRILIEKSSSTLWRPAHLLRLKKAFPDARYLHLTRHPRSHARAVLQTLDREIYLRPGLLDRSQHPPIVDPQIMWFQAHDTIDRFLADIPDENQCRMRGEDFIVNTDRTLRDVLAWLELPADDTTLAAMRHPESSPYATLGPLNAPFGNNSEFLKDARLQRGFASAESLDDPLEWRDNGSGFASNVRARAEKFGYLLAVTQYSDNRRLRD
jgi:hypothetical protein